MKWHKFSLVTPASDFWACRFNKILIRVTSNIYFSFGRILEHARVSFYVHSMLTAPNDVDVGILMIPRVFFRWTFLKCHRSDSWDSATFRRYLYLHRAMKSSKVSRIVPNSSDFWCQKGESAEFSRFMCPKKNFVLKNNFQRSNLLLHYVRSPKSHPTASHDPITLEFAKHSPVSTPDERSKASRVWNAHNFILIIKINLCNARQQQQTTVSRFCSELFSDQMLNARRQER